MSKNIIYHFICEGKSEYNYINLLNKFFKNEEINYVLKPYNLNGVFPPDDITKQGSYNKIIEMYKEVNSSKSKSNEQVIIWLDNDVFKRHELDTSKLEDRLKKEYKNQNVKIFLSYQNFEDFFIIHFKDELIKKWHSICEKNNHFDVPMENNTYLPLFQELIFQEYRLSYKKSSIDEILTINAETLNNLFKNNINKNIKFGCDLIKFIYNIVKNNT